MMMEAVFFYVLGSLMLIAATMVVLSRQPITSVLSLLAAMGCLACLFVLLGAYVIAALQVLLYAGAVLVLFVFVIMLLNLQPNAIAHARKGMWWGAGVLVASALCAQLVRVFVDTASQPLPDAQPHAGTIAALGRLLFSRYLLPFELTSFIILAAIIAAVTLAKQSPRRP
jgi:NADH-quinone oxidoreductase subunit J